MHRAPRDVMLGIEQPPSGARAEIRRAVTSLNETAPGKSGIAAPLFKALISPAAGFDVVRTMALSF